LAEHPDRALPPITEADVTLFVHALSLLPAAAEP
jgi:hypothetical protein